MYMKAMRQYGLLFWLNIAIALSVATTAVTIADADTSHTSQVGYTRLISSTHRATAASLITLREHANLHITKNTGSSLEAGGQASGTLNGSLSLRVVVDSAERLRASLVGRSRSGTISGGGVASFRVAGSSLYYTGAVSISGGTGSYAHAYGSGIHIEGYMSRQHGNISVIINGHIHT